MSFVLGPNARAAGYRLFTYERVGSTSAEALSLARGGDSGRVWIVADEQTAGVGRRGRVWHMPRGNLAASVFVVARTSTAQAATLGFVAGLSLMDALAELAPALVVGAGIDGSAGHRSRLALKWPNDLVTRNGAKVAGILLQAEKLAEDMVGVVVGIGVNVTEAPSGTDYPATSLASLGCNFTPEALFAELAEGWLDYERLWDNGAGLPAVREKWMERATGIGAEVVVCSGGKILHGRFETIDEDGRLVIRLADGQERRITAGEVHLGVVASVGSAG